MQKRKTNAQNFLKQLCPKVSISGWLVLILLFSLIYFYIYIYIMSALYSIWQRLDLILSIVAHLRSNKLVYGIFLFLSRCRKFGAPEFRCRRAKIGVILEIHWHLCRYCGNSVDILSLFCQAQNRCRLCLLDIWSEHFVKMCAPSQAEQTNKQTDQKKAIRTGVAFARWRTICCWNERTYSIGFCSTLYWCDSGLIITINPVKRKWRDGGRGRREIRFQKAVVVARVASAYRICGFFPTLMSSL